MDHAEEAHRVNSRGANLLQELIAALQRRDGPGAWEKQGFRLLLSRKAAIRMPLSGITGVIATCPPPGVSNDEKHRISAEESRERSWALGGQRAVDVPAPSSKEDTHLLGSPGSPRV